MKKNLMYHGERADMLGRIYHLFMDKAGKESHYNGIKGVRFGRVYASEDGKMKVHPEAVDPAPWKPTEAQEEAYEAHKLAVRDVRQRHRKDMELRKPNPKIAQAVQLLRPFYQRMTDIDRRRFMGWVSNECSRKGRK